MILHPTKKLHKYIKSFILCIAVKLQEHKTLNVEETKLPFLTDFRLFFLPEQTRPLLQMEHYNIKTIKFVALNVTVEGKKNRQYIYELPVSFWLQLESGLSWSPARQAVQNAVRQRHLLTEWSTSIM